MGSGLCWRLQSIVLRMCKEWPVERVQLGNNDVVNCERAVPAAWTEVRQDPCFRPSLGPWELKKRCEPKTEKHEANGKFDGHGVDDGSRASQTPLVSCARV